MGKEIATVLHQIHQTNMKRATETIAARGSHTLGLPRGPGSQH